MIVTNRSINFLSKTELVLRNQTFSIAAVSALTGLAKEVLRKWESRYGFPVPERDGAGHRKFSLDQLERLRMIKTLLDSGQRARHVVPLPVEQLKAACIAICSAPESVLTASAAADIVDILRSDDPQQIQLFLEAQLGELGVRNFIVDLVPSINALVGQAWAEGRIGIRNEHLYTERIKTVLRREIAALGISKAAPRILLTTPPGEAHTLGLLMVEAVLRLEGADCVPLGAELGVEEIVLAAAQYQVDIVALSFSTNFPLNKMSAFLKQLQRDLTPSTVIWAGGAGAARLDNHLPGVEMIRAIDLVADAVQMARKVAAQKRLHRLSGHVQPPGEALETPLRGPGD